MHRVEPKVFLIGETSLNFPGLRAYLNHIGAPLWDSDAPTGSEALVEVMGRGCYKSFGTGLNPNIKKVREGNDAYLRNILKVKHGSVIEHATVSFMFCDVSRVFTHELVRHRAGTAISQESLRFVRLEDLGQWLPSVIAEDVKARKIFAETFEQLEQLQQRLAEHYDLDAEGMKFSRKKVVTSAMRRLAPMGLATNIGWTANVRTLRWVLEARTHPSAEEEIRLVFAKVGEILCERFPNLFGDFEVVECEDGIPQYVTENSKI